MNILGISCYYHDAAAVLLRDGQLIAAAEEERFSRKKHDYDFPQTAIDFCLESGGIQGQDVDYVAFFEKPFRKFDRILMTALQTYPKSYKVFRESMITWMIDKLWVGAKISSQLGIPKDRVLFCEHHLSHAASAFLCSPFEEAAILTVDGVGEWVTGTWGVGRGNQIELKKQMMFPHSLGLLYSAFTAFLGFEVNEGEYKVMGMAPYGKPRYVDKVWKLIRQDGDGSFSLDMDYFCFHRSTDKTFNGRFIQLFGEPRPPKMLFFTQESGFPDLFRRASGELQRALQKEPVLCGHCRQHPEGDGRSAAGNGAEHQERNRAEAAVHRGRRRSQQRRQQPDFAGDRVRGTVCAALGRRRRRCARSGAVGGQHAVGESTALPHGSRLLGQSLSARRGA